MSNLSKQFLKIISTNDLPEPEPEYSFTAERKWCFDFAWIDQRVAVELQGGIYSKGGHNSIRGLERDYEKLNYAQAYGWIVLQFSASFLRNEEYIVALLKKVLEEETE